MGGVLLPAPAFRCPPGCGCAYACERALLCAPAPSRTDTIVYGDVAVVSLVASDDWASPSIIINQSRVSRP